MYDEELTEHQTGWASSHLEEDDSQPLLAGIRDGRASSATAALSPISPVQGLGLF